MKKVHKYYLSIGSNIQPEINLPKAIELLAGYGNVNAASHAWESHALGAEGPNFLNANVLFTSSLNPRELKNSAISSIELELGRIRSHDKNAPRTIDIDIVLVDGKPVNLDRWNNPFVVVPMSELLPDLKHPIDNLKLFTVANSMISQTWIKQRPEILKNKNYA